MTEWGGMQCFFRGRKNWILRYLSFYHHSIIPMSFQPLNSPIIRSLMNLKLTFKLEWHKHEEWCSNDRNDLWMSFYHSSVIPSILVHDENIPSFGVIRFIPWSFEHWNDVKWHSFEMTGMMLEWRFRSFPAHSPHSCHPRLLGKMGPFLISSLSFRTIPVIRVSFGNSQPMWISREWRRNDGRFWAEVVQFPWIYAWAGIW